MSDHDDPTPAPPHPLSRMAGEFVWEGKYEVTGRRRTPRVPKHPPALDVTEVAGSPPQAAATSIECGNATPVGGLLLAGDNLSAVAALLPTYRGRVQLIYLDPPFDSDAVYTMRAPYGSADDSLDGAAEAPHAGVDRGRRGAAGHLRLETFSDTWGSGADSYLHRMYERLVLMRELLSDSGCFFLHCDWRSSAALRLIMDEVFGAERFVNEIVWHYYNKYSASNRALPRAHDTILFYAKGAKHTFNPLRLPREAPRRQLVRESVGGVLRNARDAEGRLRYQTVTDQKGDDVWRLPQLQPASREWTGYSTQKHHDLLRRIIAMASNEGDLVADFFCGSGTTLSVAQRMGRRWLGCDQGRLALHTTRKRLLLEAAASPMPRPVPKSGPEGRSGAAASDTASTEFPHFAMCDLRPAQRRDWCRDVFGADGAAYRNHMLTAWGAKSVSPVSAPPHPLLHGVWEGPGSAMGESATGAGPGAIAVHVAAAEALCDASALHDLAEAARAAGMREVVCLAWEYAPHLWAELARRPLPEQPRVVPLLIPAEMSAPHGQPAAVFRPLPRVRLAAAPVSGAEARYTVRLLGYEAGAASGLASAASGLARAAGGVARAPSQVPPGLAAVDGWSVDFDWRPGAVFRHQWWVYRSRTQRALPTESAVVTADPASGRHTACVQISDVTGLTTRHSVTVEV